MTQTHSEKNVIVTGASRGIGKAIARELARRGAWLALLARDESALTAVAAAIEAESGCRPLVVTCDVTDHRAVARAIEASVNAMGAIHGLVNNAGANGPMALFLDVPREEFRKLIEVNLFGAVEVVRAALPHLLRTGKSSIVNIASMAGKMGVPTWSAYCSAKHGLIGFTKVIAQENALNGVTCNAVCPGFVQTDMLSEAKLEQWAESIGMNRRTLVKEFILRRTPQGRFVDVDSVAATTAFLLSDQAADITGQTFNISCGIGDY